MSHQEDIVTQRARARERVVEWGVVHIDEGSDLEGIRLAILEEAENWFSFEDSEIDSMAKDVYARQCAAKNPGK